MIRFALKLLMVMVAAGYVVRQAGPEAARGHDPKVVHASYMTGTDEPLPSEVARDLSSVTNAQIVFVQAARDISGFCDRQALACEAGRELLRRAAAGVRDISASIAGDTHTQRQAADAHSDQVEGFSPALPAAPPPRVMSF